MLSLGGLAYFTLAPARLAVIVVMVTVVGGTGRTCTRIPQVVATTRSQRSISAATSASLSRLHCSSTTCSRWRSRSPRGVANLASTPRWRCSAVIPCGRRGIVAIVVLLNLRGLRGKRHRLRHPDVRLHPRHRRHDRGRRVPAVDRGGAGGRIERVRDRTGAGQLGTLGIVFLGLRAFASGCTALTGVEAISSGVPAFRKQIEECRHHARADGRHRGDGVRWCDVPGAAAGRPASLRTTQISSASPRIGSRP